MNIIISVVLFLQHFVAHLVLAHGLIWKDQICVCNLCSFITARKAVIRVHAERIHGVHNPDKKQVVVVVAASAVTLVVVIIIVDRINITENQVVCELQIFDPAHLLDRVIECVDIRACWSVNLEKLIHDLREDEKIIISIF